VLLLLPRKLKILLLVTKRSFIFAKIAKGHLSLKTNPKNPAYPPGRIIIDAVSQQADTQIQAFFANQWQGEANGGHGIPVRYSSTLCSPFAHVKEPSITGGSFNPGEDDVVGD
jgi:hypothetical protein